MDTVKPESTTETADTTLHADGHIALIKPMEVDGQQGYALHAVDGTPLGWFDQLDVAIAAARQHNLTPVTVH